MLELNRVYCMDALAGLKLLDDNSIDCCVTSPPYWNLRSYGTEPKVWDGDANCQHEWSEEIKKPINLQAGNPEFKREWREKATDKNATQGCFCSKCGAWKGELGLEPTCELYIKHLIQIFNEVQRVLKKTGTLWVNIADSYNGNKKGNTETIKNPRVVTNNFVKPVQRSIRIKSQCCIPERFAIAMLDSGWIKRNTIIWRKGNCMPASAKDRFTIDFEPVHAFIKESDEDYEPMYFLTKNSKYYFKPQTEPSVKVHAVKSYHHLENPKYASVPAEHYKDQFDGRTWGKDGVRNKRCVWDINTVPYAEAHYATFNPELVRRCLDAGCPMGGVVLDPFMGSGSTAQAAIEKDMQFIGFDLLPRNIELSGKRIRATCEKLLADLA